MSSITVTVSELTSEGTGLAFYNGKKVFVPGVFPGESAVIEPLVEKPGYISGKLLKITDKSPDRVPDFCAMRCGGCSFTGLSYEAELGFKSVFLLHLYEDLPGFSRELFMGITGMPDPFRYRNKAVYMGERDSDGRFVLGLYERDSHRIADIPDCRLEPVWMNRIRNGLRDLINGPDSDPGMAEFAGNFRYLFLRGQANGDSEASDTGRCAVLVLRQGFVPDPVLEYLRTAGISNIAVNRNSAPGNRIFGEEFQTLRGDPYAVMSLYDRHFLVRPESFFQINTGVTEKLYDKAIELLDPAPDSVIADLYSGIGTISFRLAGRVRMVYGIEAVPEAVRDAENNSRKFGIGNVRFYAGLVEEVLPKLVNGGAKFDGVILDPARKGLEESVINTLAALKVPGIVYISCNPKTQKRDVELFQKLGYRMECLYGFDMFPHTCHVETVVLLSRDKS